MADVFMFSAQPEPDRVEKPPDPSFNAKRARPFDADVIGDSLRKSTGESFKSKLLGASGPGHWRGFGTEKEKLTIEEGDVMVMEGPNGPIMRLSEELKLKLSKPWENALILKNMGRTHTLNFMTSKLRQKWPLIGHWQLTDLDEGYFVARFQMAEDLETVLTGGPWVIANQYLAVQRWRPNFLPGEDEIRNMLVWVRLSKLPMEWIEAGLLHIIGGMLGTTIKVDPITESQARGRFARICVEIDTTKPLRSSLEVDNRAIKVEYENLGLICFNCGKIGHSRELCKEGMADMNEEIAAPEAKNKAGRTENDQFGPWMQVSYGRNNKAHVGSNLYGKKNGYNGKTGNGDNQGIARHAIEKRNAHEGPRKSLDTEKRQLKNGSSGSRFAIFNDNREEEEMIDDNQEKAPSSKILAEISNRNPLTSNQLKPSASKYLIEPPTTKNNFSKQLKENGSEIWIKKKGKEAKKIPQHARKQFSSRAAVEDSAVLQELHNNLVETGVTWMTGRGTVMTGQCSDSEGSGASMTTGKGLDSEGRSGTVATGSVQAQQQIDVSTESNFDSVASKLKEAMEIALE